jgi:hypothetical protein
MPSIGSHSVVTEVDNSLCCLFKINKEKNGVEIIDGVFKIIIIMQY